MNPVLEHVEKDLRLINEERRVKNFYQHGFAKSFIDPRPSFHYLEFNDLSGNKYPAFIISISRNEETMELTLFKGEEQVDNVFKNCRLTEVKCFGRYSKNSLQEALDLYYFKICQIMDL